MPLRRRIDLANFWPSVLWLVGALVCISATQVAFQFGGLGPFVLLSLVAGVGLIGSAAWLLFRRCLTFWRRDRGLADSAALLCTIAVIAVAIVAFDPLSVAASKLGVQLRLLAYKSDYERIIAAVRSGDLRGSGPFNAGTFDGIDFMVENEPSLRIAFPVDGLVDNWWAYVYDPSGAIAAAQGFTPTHAFSAPPEIRGLFGGDLVSCIPIGDDFFSCGFT
jgi:hypothetical protein